MILHLLLASDTMMHLLLASAMGFRLGLLAELLAELRELGGASLSGASCFECGVQHCCKSSQPTSTYEIPRWISEFRAESTKTRP
jgi:hypothetical protein